MKVQRQMGGSPALAAQLAKINTLNSEITNLGATINRSYSMAVILLALPLLMNFLYMRSWSPYREVYEVAISIFLDIIQDFQMDRKKYLENSFNHIIDGIKKIGGSAEYREKFGQTTEFNYVLKNVETLARTSPELRAGINSYKTVLCQMWQVMRDDLTKIGNTKFENIIGKGVPIPGYNVIKIMGEHDFNYHLGLMFSWTKSLYESHKSVIARVVVSMPQQAGYKLTESLPHLPKLIAPLIVMYGLSTPLLNYLYPFGIHRLFKKIY